jgi:hypothetical protein
VIDGRHLLTKVIQEAALRRRPDKQMVGRRVLSVWSTWNVLLGSGRGYFKWSKDGQNRLFSVPTWHNVVVLHDGKKLVLKIPVYNWTNLHVKDILVRYRDGDGAPAFISLKDENPRDPLSYTSQMNSEYRTSRKKTPIWEETNPSAMNNHWWDCECQLIVAMAMCGLCAFAPPPGDKEEEKEAA